MIGDYKIKALDKGFEFECVVTLLKAPLRLKISTDSNRFLDEIFLGDDYFDCLLKTRRILQTKGIFLLCNGARKDVYPSGLTRQMSDGIMAYILEMGKPTMRENRVNIFESASPNEICTIEEQLTFHNNWAKSL